MKNILPLAIGYLLPAISFAQATEDASAKLQNPIKANSFEELFKDILSDVIIPFTALVGIIFIIIAGFRFVTAQGNSTKLEAAKQNLLYVLIGVALVLAAEIILDLLLNTLTQVADVNV